MRAWIGLNLYDYYTLLEIAISELKFHDLCVYICNTVQVSKISCLQIIFWPHSELPIMYPNVHRLSFPINILIDRHGLFGSCLLLPARQKGSELYHISTKYSCSTKCKIYSAIVKGMHYVHNCTVYSANTLIVFYDCFTRLDLQALNRTIDPLFSVRNWKIQFLLL